MIVINPIIIVSAVMSPFVLSSYTDYGDMFVERYHFKGNPISTTAIKTDLARIVAVIEDKDVTKAEDIATPWSVGNMLKTLKNLTSHGSLFSRSTMKTTGYYGETGLCIPS